MNEKLAQKLFLTMAHQHLSWGRTWDDRALILGGTCLPVSPPPPVDTPLLRGRWRNLTPTVGITRRSSSCHEKKILTFWAKALQCMSGSQPCDLKFASFLFEQMPSSLLWIFKFGYPNLLIGPLPVRSGRYFEPFSTWKVSVRESLVMVKLCIICRDQTWCPS